MAPTQEGWCPCQRDKARRAHRTPRAAQAGAGPGTRRRSPRPSEGEQPCAPGPHTVASRTGDPNMPSVSRNHLTRREPRGASSRSRSASSASHLDVCRPQGCAQPPPFSLSSVLTSDPNHHPVLRRGVQACHRAKMTVSVSWFWVSAPRTMLVCGATLPPRQGEERSVSPGGESGPANQTGHEPVPEKPPRVSTETSPQSAQIKSSTHQVDCQHPASEPPADTHCPLPQLALRAGTPGTGRESPRLEAPFPLAQGPQARLHPGVAARPPVGSGPFPGKQGAKTLPSDTDGVPSRLRVAVLEDSGST